MIHRSIVQHSLLNNVVGEDGCDWSAAAITVVYGKASVSCYMRTRSYQVLLHGCGMSKVLLLITMYELYFRNICLAWDLIFFSFFFRKYHELPFYEKWNILNATVILTKQQILVQIESLDYWQNISHEAKTKIAIYLMDYYLCLLDLLQIWESFMKKCLMIC